MYVTCHVLYPNFLYEFHLLLYSTLDCQRSGSKSRRKIYSRKVHRYLLLRDDVLFNVSISMYCNINLP